MPPFGDATRVAFAKADAPEEFVYDWNGLDGFGRRVQARQEVRVTVGYDHFCQFRPTSRFGNFPGTTSGGSPTLNVDVGVLRRGGRACSVRRIYTMAVQQWDNRPLGLGGWKGGAVAGNGTFAASPDGVLASGA
jgi:hypothetical protein